MDKVIKKETKSCQNHLTIQKSGEYSQTIVVASLQLSLQYVTNHQIENYDRVHVQKRKEREKKPRL